MVTNIDKNFAALYDETMVRLTRGADAHCVEKTTASETAHGGEKTMDGDHTTSATPDAVLVRPRRHADGSLAAVETSRRLSIDARMSVPRRFARWAAMLPSALGAGIANGWRAMGHRADGTRRARMEQSPHWKGGRFRNPQPLSNDLLGAILGSFHPSPHVSPIQSVPVHRIEAETLRTAPMTGLRVTWLGHSSLLIEIDGHRVLIDPVWSGRVSPFSWIGPQRWYPPLIPLEDLPPVDAVIVSHDHYDHLDYATISAIRDWNTTFVVPLGVGAHLAYWGVPEGRVIELDWWDRATVRELEIVAAPARHASGRTLFSGTDRTLWASFALRGAKHRAWYSGDTGLFRGLGEIGDRLGPFDLTMVEVGAYARWWPDWHLGPEQAQRAHQLVRGKTLLPIHWGLFRLAFHGWTEPIERLLVAAAKANVRVVVPRPGQSIEPGASPHVLERWWPELPWTPADQHPVISTALD